MNKKLMNIINKKIELSDGRVIEIETGKLAKQADGSDGRYDAARHGDCGKGCKG